MKKKKTEAQQNCESCVWYDYNDVDDAYECGVDLDEDEIAEDITEHFEGNSLIAAGDEDMVKIHFHTNEPWLILEYGQSIGDIYDVVVENMQRQQEGLKG